MNLIAIPEMEWQNIEKLQEHIQKIVQNLSGNLKFKFEPFKNFNNFKLANFGVSLPFKIC